MRSNEQEMQWKALAKNVVNQLGNFREKSKIYYATVAQLRLLGVLEQAEKNQVGTEDLETLN